MATTPPFTTPLARTRASIGVTEHPTREGKVYCAVVLDTYSRRVVGWSIDTSPTAALATKALYVFKTGPGAGREDSSTAGRSRFNRGSTVSTRLCRTLMPASASWIGVPAAGLVISAGSEATVAGGRRILALRC
jgi:hypothetical protein